MKTKDITNIDTIIVDCLKIKILYYIVLEYENVIEMIFFIDFNLDLD